MNNLTTKRKWLYYSFYKKLIVGALTSGVVFYGLYILVMTIIGHSPSISMSKVAVIAINIFLVGLFVLTFTIDSFVLRWFRKQMVYESLEIVSLTKMPKKLPKVVYVYTCHDDMMESRLLQNMQQNYKNFEVWISDGSSTEASRRSVASIAAKHSIKLYQIGEAGSKNKADNLNAFLKNSGVVFDYLLITDSDVALDKNATWGAIKCFFSNKFRYLGFVSFILYNYETKSLYSNVTNNVENTMMYKSWFTKNFKNKSYPQLFSAGALISKELLDSNDGLFPEGCLEDVYLEHVSVKNEFSGFMLPTFPAGQAYDKTNKRTITRMCRILDWVLRLDKNGVYKRYNEKYTEWYSALIAIALSGFMFIISVVAISVVVSIFIMYWGAVINNVFFICLLVCIAVVVVVLIITATLDATSRTTINKHKFLAPIFTFLYGLSLFPYILKHWFLSLFLGKYSDFKGSKHGEKKADPKWAYIKEIKWDIILFAIFSISFILFVVLFWYFGLIQTNNLGLLVCFILFSFNLGVFSVCFLSVIILQSTSRIIDDEKYDASNFIYPREFYKFKKIKEKFYKDHPEAEKFE